MSGTAVPSSGNMISGRFLPFSNSRCTIRFISAKKEEPEWLLEWRLSAFRAWQKMTPPNWAKLNLAPIDYQAASYYSAPKKNAGPKSLEEVDPELDPELDPPFAASGPVLPPGVAFGPPEPDWAQAPMRNAVPSTAGQARRRRRYIGGTLAQCGSSEKSRR